MLAGKSVEKSVEKSVAHPTAQGLLDVLRQWRQEAAGEAAALTLPEMERRLIAEAIERAEGNLSAAARLLGISRAQLAYRQQKGQS